MNCLKRVAITMNVDNATPRNDMINQNYIRFVESLNFYPLLIPNVISDPIQYCKKFDIDGLILTGGCDIDTGLSDTPTNLCRVKCRGRDYVEWQLLEMALKQGLTVLGICRGMQFINVFFGGSITHDIKTTVAYSINHVRNSHGVTIMEPDFVNVIGSKTFIVNSFHSHGLTNNNVASSLRPFAFCDGDSIIEGIYHPNYSILGIQWHPERSGSTSDCDYKMLNTFFHYGKFWKDE